MAGYELNKKLSTRMGFEPTHAEHNGLAVHRLNHSAHLVLHEFVFILATISIQPK